MRRKSTSTYQFPTWRRPDVPTVVCTEEDEAAVEVLVDLEYEWNPYEPETGFGDCWECVRETWPAPFEQCELSAAERDDADNRSAGEL